SLCSGWSVRDVAGHLVAWDDLLVYRCRREHVIALLRFGALYAGSLGSMNLINRRLQRRTRNLDAEALTRRLGADDGDDIKWLFDGTNPGAHLAEYVLHHQDIRRPLRLSREVPRVRLVDALPAISPIP